MTPIIVEGASNGGFTQVAVSGVVKMSDDVPAAGASVTFLLSEPISDGTQVIAPEMLSALCAVDGSFLVTLNANDDETTTPVGTCYKVKVMYEGAALDAFSVVVPRSGAIGGVDLFSLSPPNA